ncbi:lycopene cyclase domain-containing protein [Demequina sp. SO4-18]|uniref:lycopene cyclase domain-containing protein n=1 Tax=Demequina sp. SO4-18 TaxID=3401026 RepID=UPI003B5A06E2
MTYVALSVAVLAVLTVATLPLLRRLPRRPLLLTLVVLLVLTVVFDNIIVGVGLVAYDESLISGVRMPIAPVEDLAYAIASVMIVPVLWLVFGGRRSRDGSANDGDGDGDGDGKP